MEGLTLPWGQTWDCLGAWRLGGRQGVLVWNSGGGESEGAVTDMQSKLVSKKNTEVKTLKVLSSDKKCCPVEF